MGVDLSTKYMGLDLGSPLVVSACPLSESLTNVEMMQEHGAGAIVMFSLFEEQIRKSDPAYDDVSFRTSKFYKDYKDFFPADHEYRVGCDQYLEIIQAAKKRVDIPIIASLNGITDAGWIDYAKEIEQAGADGLEMNVYFIPTDMLASAEEVEKRYLHIIGRVRASVSIPISVKLSPYFSSFGNMAWRVVNEGVEGIVLFNRFYQPDFDINKISVFSDLDLSVPNEIRLPLLWISLLYKKFDTSIAATSGVQGGKEVIKYLLAGADAVMMASALYRHGIEYLYTMKREISSWMNDHEFESVNDFKGRLSQQNIMDTTAFERANYIKVLEGIRE